uniref:AB hydrolase-1 domain-containing protein n=1 Tax=Craspedostauros australis TaxID=1486917 RepID=A0A7R9WYF1_9STRA|mmetsp:Transcript_2351/g.6499  ORF Transcript_2351/g.6499 Transcript_2351/m.6499 type:complete len:346 (+) Transcript_2351:230-1267(+)
MSFSLHPHCSSIASAFHSVATPGAVQSSKDATTTIHAQKASLQLIEAISNSSSTIGCTIQTPHWIRWCCCTVDPPFLHSICTPSYPCSNQSDLCFSLTSWAAGRATSRAILSCECLFLIPTAGTVLLVLCRSIQFNPTHLLLLSSSPFSSSSVTTISYSIDQSVEDIKTVLSSVFLNYSSIHVLGHSFGGVLAYEFQQGSSQTDEPSRIRSLILSNAPTSMKVANDAYEDLERKNPMTFVQKYVCQVDAPPELQSAFQSAGKVWSGMDVVLQYVPQPPKDENFPPTLVVGGAHDFALPSTEGWKEVLPFATYEVLEDTSHYPFYERKDAYGDLIESFLQKVEGNG